MDKKPGKNRVGEIYKNTPVPKNRNIERDGVVYTPSNEARKRSEADMLTRKRAEPKPPVRTQTAIRKIPEKKPQRSQFAIFFIFVTFFSAIACVVTFALVFSSLSPNASDAPSKTPNPTFSQAPEQSAAPDGKTAAITALILKSHIDPKKLDLYDYISGKKLTVFFDAQTDLKDKYGKTMSFGEFVEGEIVDAVYLLDDSRLKSLRTSVNAWSYKSVTGAVADAEMMILTLSGESYAYDKNSSISYNGELFDMSQLDKIDVIDVKGYDKYLTELEVIKSHGILEVVANAEIIGGSIELDTNLIFDFSESVYEKIPEGSHRAVIKGSNIEPFIKEFSIAKGENFRLELGELKFTSGRLSVSANEADAKLSVNGTTKQLGEQLSLPFGEYIIKVEKEGFAPWEQTVQFEEAVLEVNATLEKIVTTSELTVTSEPSGAEVYIDSNYVGVSPCTVQVEFGQRTISVRKSGYVTIDFPIVITEQNVSPNIILQPQTGGF